MNELITTALIAGDVTPLTGIPDYLLNSFEKEWIAWIMNYVKTYGEIPSLDRMRRDHPHFIPLTAEKPLPLADVFDLTIKRKRREFTIDKLNAIVNKTREEEIVPIEDLNSFMIQLSLTDSGLDKYSTFDRDLYFRTGGLKLGMPLIDRAIGGFAKGDYGIISGRLGTGKTTVQGWAMYKWWLDGARILCISKEMLASELFARIDGMVGKFNPLKIRQEDSPELRSRLKVVSSIAKGHSGEIIIPSRQVNSPSQIATLARYLAVDVIVVDGIYLMHPDTAHAAKWESVAQVSNELKQIAMDLQVPLLGSTQIKRVGVKDEYDPEDLAYSDAIGQDADFVLALKPSKAEKRRIEIQLIKNRHGPVAGTIIYVDHETMTITDESVEGVVELGREEE